MRTDEEILKHVQAGLELEKQSMKMYNDLSFTTENAHAKIVFEKMVEEEKKHVTILQDLHDALSKQEIEGVVDEVEEMEPEKITFVHDEQEATSDYLNSLNTIVEFEKRAYEFYKNAAQKTTDPKVKEIFLRLEAFEKQHMDVFGEELTFAKENPYSRVG